MNTKFFIIVALFVVGFIHCNAKTIKNNKCDCHNDDIQNILDLYESGQFSNLYDKFHQNTQSKIKKSDFIKKYDELFKIQRLKDLEIKKSQMINDTLCKIEIQARKFNIPNAFNKKYDFSPKGDSWNLADDKFVFEWNIVITDSIYLLLNH